MWRTTYRARAELTTCRQSGNLDHTKSLALGRLVALVGGERLAQGLEHVFSALRGGGGGEEEDEEKEAGLHFLRL